MPRETASPIKVVFLDRATLGPDAILRAPTFPHLLESYDRTAPTEVSKRISNADIVITNKVPLSADAIAAAPRLAFVAVAATGFDVVDVEACKARGVIVSNIRGYARTTVPEHVFALIFALRRNLVAYRDAVSAGRWQAAGQFCFFDYPILDLAGATLGLVGGGELGGQVGAIARALGMHVTYAGRKGSNTVHGARIPFETVLRTSDVISLHCPYTPGTHHLIGAPEFALMERRPLLINTARGGLVDEDALAAALDRGQLAGAGFDVATAEPPPLGHPLMRLLDRPNFILTPHVAWASRAAVQALADQLIDNLDAFVSGDPRNRVA